MKYLMGLFFSSEFKIIGYPSLCKEDEFGCDGYIYISIARAIFLESKGHEVTILFHCEPEHDERLKPHREKIKRTIYDGDFPDGWFDGINKYASEH